MGDKCSSTSSSPPQATSKTTNKLKQPVVHTRIIALLFEKLLKTPSEDIISPLLVLEMLFRPWT
jgi:hypothetical protein